MSSHEQSFFVMSWPRQKKHDEDESVSIEFMLLFPFERRPGSNVHCRDECSRLPWRRRVGRGGRV